MKVNLIVPAWKVIDAIKDIIDDTLDYHYIENVDYEALIKIRQLLINVNFLDKDAEDRDIEEPPF